MLAGLPDITIKKLERLQKSAARFLVRKSSDINEILKELHWLPVRYRISYKLSLLVYKCLNGKGPGYLTELLVRKKSSKTLRSDSDTMLLEIPKVTTETFGKRSFRYSAIMAWNVLPFLLKCSPSVDIFKRDLKTFLFKKAFNLF